MACYFRKHDRIAVGAVILPKVHKIAFYNTNGYSLAVALMYVSYEIFSFSRHTTVPSLFHLQCIHPSRSQLFLPILIPSPASPALKKNAAALLRNVPGCGSYENRSSGWDLSSPVLLHAYRYRFREAPNFRLVEKPD
jgi:hypothetical protein